MRTIPYGRQWIDENDIKEVIKVLRSHWITQGPKIKEFEDALCRYTGARYAVAVSSGTAALHIACLAAGISKNDEVITSPITFVASANCVLYCGGKPVFADIQADTVNIDPGEVEKKITRRTKSIIPVHFAGHPCDLREIKSIAKKHNLIVIEDAAHALGAEYRGSKIGACKYSDMTILSFHPVKHITTGEGGAVLTNRKDVYKKLRMLRNHGVTKEKYLNNPDGDWYYEMQNLGFNYRITDFQCALGLSQMKKLEQFIVKKKEVVNFYNRNLSKILEIKLPTERSYAKSSWHLYYIRLDGYKKRKRIFEKMKALGLGVQVHYIPVYWHPYYEQLGYKRGACPTAEEFYQQVISIPLYPQLSQKEMEFIKKTICKLLKQDKYRNDN